MIIFLQKSPGPKIIEMKRNCQCVLFKGHRSLAARHPSRAAAWCLDRYHRTLLIWAPRKQRLGLSEEGSFCSHHPRQLEEFVFGPK